MGESLGITRSADVDLAGSGRGTPESSGWHRTTPFALTENFVNIITNGVPLVTLDHLFPTNLGGAPSSNARLLYPGYQSITYIDKGSVATYHAMQVGFSHRYAGGVLADSVFQWINEISDDPYCRRCEMAKSFVDTLDFRANFIWEFPVGRGKRFGANLNRVANAVSEAFSSFSLAGGYSPPLTPRARRR